MPAANAAFRSAMVAWSSSTALAAGPCVSVRESERDGEREGAEERECMARHVSRPAAGCVALRADGRHADAAHGGVSCWTVSATIFKIVPERSGAAAEAAGSFTGSPVDLADGFIHFSTAAQVEETAARHFAGQAGCCSWPSMPTRSAAACDGSRRGMATCSRISTGPCRSAPCDGRAATARPGRPPPVSQRGSHWDASR